MKLNILALSQKDPKWGRKKLGNSNSLISSYGCLLTCHAMMLIYYGHDDLTPDTLNELYKNKNVYDKDLINFWAASNCFEDITADEYYNCYNDPCDLSKIDTYLDQKKPVIAWVDFSPKDDVPDHFVLIIGKENDSYLVNDPWTGETYFFEAKFGDPKRYIFGLRLYSGIVNEEENLEDKVSDLEDKVKRLDAQILEQSVIVGQLEGELSKQEAENKDLANQLATARIENLASLREKEQMAAQAGKLEKDIESLVRRLDDKGRELEAVKSSLATCKDTSVEDLGSWDLISRGFRKLFSRGGEKQ